MLSHSSSSAFPLTVLSGEPRVYDIILGERLGFDRPINIRNMIKRNMDKLQTFGPLSIVERVINGGNAREFYLNQKQSIFICMKSETDRAFDVQVEIVRVFDAYLNGELKPVAPQTFAQALRLAAEQQERIEQQQQELEATRPKALFHDQVVSSETLLDFASMFSLLQRKTGQRFNRATFLSFARRHGVACQPNPYNGSSQNRFIPRQAYIGSWFVSEMHGNGVTEWMVRPIAIAGIVSLIEIDRSRSPLQCDDEQEAA